MFFPFLGNNSCVGYNYTKPSLKPLDIQFGGKEAFRRLFSIMTPNNVHNCLLAWGAGEASTKPCLATSSN
jgi:hypothetical protein